MGFDDMIITLCVHGMSARHIQRHVGEIHSIEISPGLVSAIRSSRKSPPGMHALESSYAIVSFDALRLKRCDEELSRTGAVYFAISVRA